jgi:hypothetical protein
MSMFNHTLDHVRVAAPCNVDWDSMFGDERVRFCGQCKLNVYNLSEMSKTEAEQLVTRAEGRLCIRYYQRRDGSIITRNCPVGLRAIKRRLSRVASAVGSALLTFLAGIGVYDIATRLSLVRDRSVMGSIAVREVDVNLLPPSVTGEMVLTPPPFVPVAVTGTFAPDVVVGRLVPIQRSKWNRR